MKIPLTISNKPMHDRFKPIAGKEYIIQGRVDIETGASNEAEKLCLEIIFVLDVSGSTSEFIPGADKQTVLEAIKQSVKLILGYLRPGDRFAIVVFNNRAELLVPFCAVTDANKVEACRKIDGLKSDNNTNFINPLKYCKTLFESGKLDGLMKKKAVLFFTDGKHEEHLEHVFGGLTHKSDPAPYCDQLRSIGVEVLCGGLNVTAESTELLTRMAGPSNYQLLSDAMDVKQFFLAAQAKMVYAGFTNAIIKAYPSVAKLDIKIKIFELIFHQDQDQYQPTSDDRCLQLGPIMPSDKFSCLIAFSVVLPDNIDVGQWSYLKFELIADVPSEGTKQVLISTSRFVVEMAHNDGFTNKDVAEFVTHAAGVRKVFEASKATDIAVVQSSIAQARQTLQFSNLEASKKLQVALAEATKNQDPQVAASMAARATKAHVPAAAIKKLIASRKGESK